ncbi:MAG TPA: ribose-5-phosphate isomerase RpiA [Solirubrobacteraceae bacterium]|jgi:ribose 5-phosphate isomerase A|nr:ribose-5-phosphate isomerase RpiA [Solirubrobacteraceae bacterium]
MEIDRAHDPSSPQPGDDSVEQLKRIAAQAAAALVEDGMTVGLGTGSTVVHLLPALAQRGLSGLRCVATSAATEHQALALGLPILSLDDVNGRLDIAIDGADQVSPEGWLIKGGGGAHTREKIVAAAASRFVVIVSAEKLVERLHPPVPLELLCFGLSASMRALDPTRLRDVPPSPDGNLIADYLGPIEDPHSLAALLSGTPGVVEHGLFAPQMVSEVLVGEPEGVRRLPGAKRTPKDLQD